MEFTFDPEKDAANIAKHGVSLAAFAGFDDDPIVRIDGRYEYGEVRYRAYGRIAGRGFCIIFMRREAMIRLISFRRAHEKEMRRYE
ncbi:hypothetical protein ASF00_15010 [Sphingomonas sp. Leaf34]|uniref:BrnT family toxin n=1 Tax=Sphingomonas sp. Leaf34 TaxID=1736216 RepID=UPI0006FE1F90|nr:BrnT family toxin [Sphingomonas sp. Leaf34]KQN24168.1 hypothetical protein ASF00_15010 [Sphingomonas sp. Leaf34]